MIVERIRLQILPGAIIPKPSARAPFSVKAWGTRRNEHALIYFIPNHRKPELPYQKGVTASEFEIAYSQLRKSGEFTRQWFNEHLSNCAKEGGCNFTTIGGIFVLLGEAKYLQPAKYVTAK